MKKIIFLLLGICSLLVISFSCGDNKAKIELKKAIAEVNKMCPMQYDFATLVGTRIEDGNLVFDYVCEDGIVSYEEQNNDSESEKWLKGSSILFSDESFGDLVMRSGYGFTANYEGSGAGKSYTFHLSNEEIKGIKENPASKSELLDWNIKNLNATLPQQFDVATTLTSVNNQGDIVFYFFEIDEDVLEMSLVENNLNGIKENFKQELEQEWSSPTSIVKQFFSLVCRTNKSLRYVYRGKTTGKELTIEFSNAELRNISHDYIEEE